MQLHMPPIANSLIDSSSSVRPSRNKSSLMSAGTKAQYNVQLLHNHIVVGIVGEVREICNNLLFRLYTFNNKSKKRTLLLRVLILRNESLQIDEPRRSMISSSSLHIALGREHE